MPSSSDMFTTLWKLTAVSSAAKRQELERLRGLLAEAKAVLDFFNEDSPEREIATPEELARWIMRYDGIVAALEAKS